MATKTLYATGTFKYQNRMMKAGDPVEMTDPHRRLYLALGKVTDEKPKGARVGYELQGSGYDAGAAGHELVGRDAEPKAPAKKAAPRKKKAAAKK